MEISECQMIFLLMKINMSKKMVVFYAEKWSLNKIKNEIWGIVLWSYQWGIPGSRKIAHQVTDRENHLKGYWEIYRMCLHES